MKKLILIIVVVVALFVAWEYQAGGPPLGLRERDEVILVTYKNDKYGFSLKHPGDWVVKEVIDDADLRLTRPTFKAETLHFLKTRMNSVSSSLGTLRIFNVGLESLINDFDKQDSNDNLTKIREFKNNNISISEYSQYGDSSPNSGTKLYFFEHNNNSYLATFYIYADAEVLYSLEFTN